MANFSFYISEKQKEAIDFLHLLVKHKELGKWILEHIKKELTNNPHWINQRMNELKYEIKKLEEYTEVRQALQRKAKEELDKIIKKARQGEIPEENLERIYAYGDKEIDLPMFFEEGIHITGNEFKKLVRDEKK